LIHSQSLFHTKKVASSSSTSNHFNGCRQHLISFLRTFNWLQLIPNF